MVDDSRRLVQPWQMARTGNVDDGWGRRMGQALARNIGAPDLVLVAPQHDAAVRQMRPRVIGKHGSAHTAGRSDPVQEAAHRNPVALCVGRVASHHFIAEAGIRGDQYATPERARRRSTGAGEGGHGRRASDGGN